MSLCSFELASGLSALPGSSNGCATEIIKKAAGRTVVNKLQNIVLIDSSFKGESNAKSCYVVEFSVH